MHDLWSSHHARLRVEDDLRDGGGPGSRQLGQLLAADLKLDPVSFELKLFSLKLYFQLRLPQVEQLLQDIEQVGFDLD